MTGRIQLVSRRKGVVPPGTRLNNMFEIESLLSAGGMGEVYKGHNILTHDAVAIKIVLPEFAENELIVELFRKEARILNHLYHEAIVRYYVFSIDAEMGRPFLAMEYVDGPSLSAVLKESALDTAAVIVLQKRLAEGLLKAHEAGVIHRDIAPDNIILPNQAVDQAKIIDFGIARSAVGGGTILDGRFAGKYNFVSPEQLGLFDGEVTCRSDIYSLGLVVAACLRGHPLDMGGTQFEVVEKRRTVPDLSGIDPALRDLIEAMLQPDPADRPQSMAEIIEWLSHAELDLAREPTVIVAKYPTRSRTSRARVPLIIAGVGLSAVAGIGAWYLFENRPEVGFEPETASSQSADHPVAVTDVLQYVGHYAGGDCYFVQPAEVSPSNAAIIGFGNRVDPFSAFRSAFTEKFGFEPQLELRLVSDAQCVVINALAALTIADSGRLLLQLSHDRLRSGDVLTGTVSDLGNRHAEVLLVDDLGLIHNLRGLTERTGDSLIFSGTMELPRAEVEPQPQLVIIIASETPLHSLARQWPQGHVPASELIPELLDEIARLRADVVAAAGYLKIGE